MSTDLFGNHFAGEYDPMRFKTLQFKFFAFKTNEYQRQFGFSCHYKREAAEKAWGRPEYNATAQSDLETTVLTTSEFIEMIHEIEDDGGSVDFQKRIIRYGKK